jgi:GNAT superfamily N-acetyltransferase
MSDRDTLPQDSPSDAPISTNGSGHGPAVAQYIVEARQRLGLPGVEPVTTDDQLRELWPIVQAFHGLEHAGRYVERVRRMQAAGYRLVGYRVAGQIVGVAGYRVLDMLSGPRVLWLDDLAVAPEYRGQGHGAVLMRWLRAEARALGCLRLHVGVRASNTEAHRFYARERFALEAFHFVSERLS